MQRRAFIAASAALGMTSRMSLASTGYHVPAEENRHQRTFMQWPVSRIVHPDPVFLDMTQRTIARIANAIADFEPVTMLAHRDDHAKAQRFLSRNVTLWDIPTEDLWCRDAGPIFVKGPAGLAVSQIQFNGWGEKQVNTRDSKIAAAVADRLGLDLIATGLTGEAGAVEQDGHGTLMAHESSWINDNRNPGMTRNQVEDRLLKAYGASKMIWSTGVYGQDITDYHIDSLARFTGPKRVLINLPAQPDKHDDFHIAARDTYDALIGAGLQVDVIPEPRKPRVKSRDFVASYANYYVCNGAVIAAQFGDAHSDAVAVDALRRHYPNREVIMLNVDPLGELGGGIHCATQQMPA